MLTDKIVTYSVVRFSAVAPEQKEKEKKIQSKSTQGKMSHFAPPTIIWVLDTLAPYLQRKKNIERKFGSESKKAAAENLMGPPFK